MFTRKLFDNSVFYITMVTGNTIGIYENVSVLKLAIASQIHDLHQLNGGMVH